MLPTETRVILLVPRTAEASAPSIEASASKIGRPAHRHECNKALLLCNTAASRTLPVGSGFRDALLAEPLAAPPVPLQTAQVSAFAILPGGPQRRSPRHRGVGDAATRPLAISAAGPITSPGTGVVIVGAITLMMPGMLSATRPDFNQDSGRL